jgi:hypothetical protein
MIYNCSRYGVLLFVIGYVHIWSLAHFIGGRTQLHRIQRLPSNSLKQSWYYLPSESGDLVLSADGPTDLSRQTRNRGVARRPCQIGDRLRIEFVALWSSCPPSPDWTPSEPSWIQSRHARWAQGSTGRSVLRHSEPAQSH